MENKLNVYNQASEYIKTTQSVVTIGTFDGVHIGHNVIIKQLVTSAKKNNLESVLLTFFPHPRMVLQKESNIKLINTINERKQLLAKTGLNNLIIHPFTKEFSRLSALEFVRDILVNKFHVKKIIIGYDHHFGRNRTATIEDLREFGKTYDFEVIEISAQEVNEIAISSTKIRKALQEGKIEIANAYLGYNFMLPGTVVRGKGIGKTLGYPTANLRIDEDYKIIPKKGIYIVKSIINKTVVFGMMSIGTNPTVGGSKLTIETSFLNIDVDLYDKKLEIEMLSRIRDEQKFDSVEALITAIRNDEKIAKAYISSHE